MFWTWGYGVLKLANVDKKSFKRVQVTSSATEREFIESNQCIVRT